MGQILSLAVSEAVQKDNVNQAEAVVLTQVWLLGDGSVSHAGGQSRPFKSSFGIMCSASHRKGTKCATDLI